MAIAFHPPEISAAAAPAPHQATQYPSNATVAHVVHQQFGNVQGAPPPGGVFILSPSSAVIQQYQHHHQTATALWVSTPQSVVAQQQMFSGFPPIFHNTTAAVAVAAPQYHRVASYPPQSSTRTPLAPSPIQQQQRCHRCVTGAAIGCCTTCNDIRRVYLLISLMLSNLVYAALRGL